MIESGLRLRGVSEVVGGVEEHAVAEVGVETAELGPIIPVRAPRRPRNRPHVKLRQHHVSEDANKSNSVLSSSLISIMC